MPRKIYQFNPNNGIKVVLSKEVELMLSLEKLRKAWGIRK